MHPLMLFAAIAFWGWQGGQWLAAAVAAALLCTSFYTLLHWQHSKAQLSRVADFCTVLALLLGVYFYVAYGNPRAIILFFVWLPFALLPLALMHAYGATKRMDLSVLFWSVRRNPPTRAVTFDPWFPYYAIWIIAASAANARGPWFYVGLVALVSWPLVRIRPWSYRVGTWGVAFSLAIALGFGLQYGLRESQIWLESAVPEWISGGGSRTDPYRATTDIGHIGKLKDSDAIVLRVIPANGASPPVLLHRASYNTYFNAAWLARGATFHPVAAAPANRWPLAAAEVTAARVTIHDYTVRPNPVLSLPAGTSAVEALNAITMQRNTLGAVQIVRDPGYFSYVAAYAEQELRRDKGDNAPTVEDTRLPPREREAFATLADELGLKQLPPADAVNSVKQYFSNGYRYATYQKDAPVTGSPIVDFLLRTKSGHCEYYATATALLLRAGGIPALYATGFAVDEKSEREHAYLVRARHAHAWVRAYVDGAWIDVDTTPPSWFSVEAENASTWTRVADLWSWLRFSAARAWADSNMQPWVVGALLAGLPLVLWLGWRLYRSRRTLQQVSANATAAKDNFPGADSEYYRIEQQLEQRTLARQAHETVRDWLARLATNSTGAGVETASLADIIDLHYRYRFDPAGLTTDQRERLKQGAADWLARDAARRTNAN